MDQIMSFSPETCEELKYYVYRLVDPRNGNTFYVGKGKNNRVFAHVACALSEYTDVDYDSQMDDKENLKYQTIRAIQDAGLDVIHIIQRYGLSEHDALVIESALIDVYCLEQLTNKIKGHSSNEPENAITLEKRLSASEFDESVIPCSFMIIKVKNYMVDQRGSRYEATRSSWRVNLSEAQKYQYVLSVTGGIVYEVYKVHEWHYHHGESGRVEFTGEKAEENIRDLFVNKKIPAKYRKKGQASPCLYGKKQLASILDAHEAASKVETP